jgi:hypothetical protein
VNWMVPSAAMATNPSLEPQFRRADPAEAERLRMFIRIAGVAALGAGLALLIGFVGATPDVNRYTVPAFYTLGVIGLAGIHLRQVGARPALAWFGFVAALIGLGWGIASLLLSWAEVLPPSGGAFGYLGGVALWIGATALGVVILAIGVIPRTVGRAFAIGAPLAMIGLLSTASRTGSSALDVVSQAGIVVFALGWISAGVSLLTVQRRHGVMGTSAQ